MITRVRLRNWKSHAQTELRFGDGTNLLVGGMGSGKSSVLEAISMGLFGKVPGLKERGVKLEDLIRSKPEPAESAEVEVGFSLPTGEEYVVRRVIRRKGGTTSAELRKADGTLVEGGTSGKVTELVEKLLGLNYDLFERAVYSQQNRLDYFLTLRPAERKKKVDEVMGMDRLEVARQKLGTLSKRLSEEARDRRRMVEGQDREALLRQLEELRRKREGDERKAEELRRKEGELSPRLEEVRKRLEELEELGRRVERLRTREREEGARIEQLQRQQEELRAKLGGPPDLEALEREAGEAERAHSEARAEEERAGSELLAAERRKGSLRAELQGMEGQRRALEQRVREKEAKEGWLREVGAGELPSRLEEVRKRLEEVRGELARVEAREGEVRKGLEELSSAGSSCPVCEAPLDGGRKEALQGRRRRELEELGRRRAELRVRLRELGEEERRLSELERRVRTVEGELKELPELRRELERLGEERVKKEGELEACEKGLEVLRERHRQAGVRKEESWKRWQEARARLELARSLLELERQLRDRRVQHLSLQRELWELERKYREEEVRRAREEKETLLRQLEGLRGELRGLERLLKEEGERLELLRRDLLNLRRLELEALRLEEASEALGLLQVALSRTQAMMRELFVEQVNQLMEDLWQEVYPYGDYTSLRLSVGEGGDYEFELRDRRGNWLPVEGVASGGERTDACFVMRVALAKVMAPGLGWIVLDEPTHNLDAEAIQELARVLKDRLPSLVRQVLLITHEERLEAAVSGYLYRFSRDKDREGPTVVEQISLPQVF
ncbi:MAG: SMC family ATPase [Candidatus Hadarchaeales archaeon]